MKTRLVPPPAGIEDAVRLLASGELVAVPTETVYGLGAAALDPLACAKIFEAKERPLSDPLIVHLPSSAWLEKLARTNELALRLVEKFWPGPLTLVLPRRPMIPDIVTAGQETVALRLSAHPIFQQVAERFGQPIAAPSANRFGRISPTSAAHVLSELEGRIPFILDGGPCSHGIESTIVLIRDEGMEILRHGPVTSEQLREFGTVAAGRGEVSAPGTMKSHYAPLTPLVISWHRHPADVSLGSSAGSRCHVGLLAWKAQGEGYDAVERLSQTQDLREAAANLYRAMRRLDEAGLDLIVAEPVPEIGLGVAIMDRLRKAAARDGEGRGPSRP